MKTKLIILSGFILCISLLMFSDFFSKAKKQDNPIDRIILITLDTLRTDHLGCYGYPRNTSPFIDQLAADGIQFQRVFAAINRLSHR